MNNKLIQTYKYQIKESISSVVVFYAIVVVVILLTSLIPKGQESHNQISGMDFASLVFIFVAGLNCFKSSFKFSQQFNVSRKTFFVATLASLLTLAAGMAIIDTALNRVFSLIVNYQSLYELNFKSGIALQLVWELVLLSMGAALGWFVNLLYYRSNKTLKIIISLSPVYLSILLGISTRSMPVVGMIVAFLLGLSPQNIGMSILGMCVTILIALVGTFLLIRRAPVKA